MLEIKYYGRGGQGAKTAAFLFAQMCFEAGRFVQAFVEHGPEGMGAPVISYNRISSHPIILQGTIIKPDIIVVLDETLVETMNIFEKISSNTLIIINTIFSPDDMRRRTGLNRNKIYTLNVPEIFKRLNNIGMPNSPMLGALIRVTDIFDLEKGLKTALEKLAKKFLYKPEFINQNIEAIKCGYYEVKD